MYIITTAHYYVGITMYEYSIDPVYRVSVPPSGLMVVWRYLGHAHCLVQIRRGLGIDPWHLNWHLCLRCLLLS
jgi:hypothetical protein